MIVYRRAGDGAFPRVATLQTDESARLSTPLLSGFSLPLPDVFA